MATLKFNHTVVPSIVPFPGPDLSPQNVTPGPMEALAPPACGQGSANTGCLLPIWHGGTSSMGSSPTKELSGRSPSQPELPGRVLSNVTSPPWFPELVCGQRACIIASSWTFSPPFLQWAESWDPHLARFGLKKVFLARAFHFQEGYPSSVGVGLTKGPVAGHLLSPLQDTVPLTHLFFHCGLRLS